MAAAEVSFEIAPLQKVSKFQVLLHKKVVEGRRHDDRLKVLHDDQEGRDLRAQVGAQLRQEGEEEGGRQKGQL